MVQIAKANEKAAFHSSGSKREQPAWAHDRFTWNDSIVDGPLEISWYFLDSAAHFSHLFDHEYNDVLIVVWICFCYKKRFKKDIWCTYCSDPPLNSVFIAYG